MILSDITIRKMLQDGTLKIDPVREDQIQPASVDIRIGSSFSTLKATSLTPVDMKSAFEYETIFADQFVIAPGQFLLATTLEYFSLPNNLTAFVEGRSSVGRLGLFIQNAGWVDPGFEGEITLELFNASQNSIILETGRRVGQLVFAQLDQDAQNPYRGKYQGQRGATGSRIYEDK